MSCDLRLVSRNFGGHLSTNAWPAKIKVTSGHQTKFRRAIRRIRRARRRGIVGRPCRRRRPGRRVRDRASAKRPRPSDLHRGKCPKIARGNSWDGQDRWPAIRNCCGTCGYRTGKYRFVQRLQSVARCHQFRCCRGPESCRSSRCQRAPDNDCLSNLM